MSGVRAAARGALAIAVLLGATPLALPQADPGRTLRALAAEAGQGPSPLRIGLDAGHALQIGSERPFRVLDAASGETVWRETFRGELRVVAEGGPEGEVPAVFRIQTGAFGSREAAEAERARLERTLGAPAVVRHVPDRGSWRVRVGEASDRAALSPLLDRLREAGATGVWIVEEPLREPAGVTLRLVDASWESRLTGRTRLAVVPTPGARLRVEGKPYRGVVELRVGASGQVRAINWIEREQYLLGVVPAELGPEVWPQLEALKAQAVAARTYVQRNIGQFEDEGFDLCATPRCQVYAGAGAEHPLSDRAVATTRGEILTWGGSPINAMYTATCGGHTEDGGEIFPEEKAPYLRGVACRAERDVLESLRSTLRGKDLAARITESGEDVTRDAALLAAAGVLASERSPMDRLRPLSPSVLREWTARLAGLAGRPAPTGPAGPSGTLGEAAASVVSDLGWEERATLLLSGEDLAALLRDPESATLPERQRRALAYLALQGALQPRPDGRFGVHEAPSESRILPALARIGEAYEAFGLRDAVIGDGRHGTLRLVRGKGEMRLPLSRDLLLFGFSGGRAVPAQELELWPGDRVRYRTDPQGRIDFLELRPPVKGVSDDRSAAVYSWEVRRTRQQLEGSVNRRVSVGRLVDLQVVRRGVSGRIVELRVVGESGTAIVRGFDIRNLLDLREILTTVEVQRDGQGRLEAAVFAGKGWGHGVGLCQVGAYGMALRGSGYREILAHYYRGAELHRLDP